MHGMSEPSVAAELLPDLDQYERLKRFRPIPSSHRSLLANWQQDYRRLPVGNLNRSASAFKTNQRPSIQTALTFPAWEA